VRGPQAGAEKLLLAAIAPRPYWGAKRRPVRRQGSGGLYLFRGFKPVAHAVHRGNDETIGGAQIQQNTQAGDVVEDTIEVNRPLKISGWNIYQLSYDETKGRWSDVSVFELVRDPWLPAVYAGIIMMVLGAVCLFVNAPKGKEERKEETV
jgi:hypothetical protein